MASPFAAAWPSSSAMSSSAVAAETQAAKQSTSLHVIWNRCSAHELCRVAGMALGASA